MNIIWYKNEKFTFVRLVFLNYLGIDLLYMESPAANCYHGIGWNILVMLNFGTTRLTNSTMFLGRVDLKWLIRFLFFVDVAFICDVFNNNVNFAVDELVKFRPVSLHMVLELATI